MQPARTRNEPTNLGRYKMMNAQVSSGWSCFHTAQSYHNRSAIINNHQNHEAMMNHKQPLLQTSINHHKPWIDCEWSVDWPSIIGTVTPSPGSLSIPWWRFYSWESGVWHQRLLLNPYVSSDLTFDCWPMTCYKWYLTNKLNLKTHQLVYKPQ